VKAAYADKVEDGVNGKATNALIQIDINGGVTNVKTCTVHDSVCSASRAFRLPAVAMSVPTRLISPLLSTSCEVKHLVHGATFGCDLPVATTMYVDSSLSAIGYR
jgi:hypothetical protein